MKLWASNGDMNYTPDKKHIITQLGSNWNNGSNAGGFDWNCNNGVGDRYRNFGGRPVYVPTANV